MPLDKAGRSANLEGPRTPASDHEEGQRCAVARLPNVENGERTAKKTGAEKIRNIDQIPRRRSREMRWTGLGMTVQLFRPTDDRTKQTRLALSPSKRRGTGLGMTVRSFGRADDKSRVAKTPTIVPRPHYRSRSPWGRRTGYRSGPD